MTPEPSTQGLDNTCTALMRDGSKSFFAASRVLPARVRGPATALYAFCRVADDAIDLSPEPQQALSQLHDRLDRLYDGRPLPFDADRALAPVVARYAIPRSLLEALLEGFAWDAQGRHYETLADVQAYAARVAGTVGAMMSLIMDTRSAPALARACELGVAMQLTNIARDVGEDARNGRLYLPRQWLREAGIAAEAFVRKPQFSPALGQVVQRLLANAQELYKRAEHGIAALPRDCRPAIQAARLVYADIGQEVQRAGFDAVTRRAVVSQERKLALVARAMTAAVRAPSAADLALPALPAVQYLVDAAAQAPWPQNTAAAWASVRAARANEALPPADGNFYQRTVRMIDLFERQAQRRRDGAAEGAARQALLRERAREAAASAGP